MKIRINKILIIDDDSITTFLNSIIIQHAVMVGQIDIAHDGEKGIEYLKGKSADGEGQKKSPELIFLDLNMPLMDGWEFLDEFAMLDVSIKSSTIIYIVSASPNPLDRQKAEHNPYVSGFINKPLSEQSITKILEKHFEC